MNLTLEKYTVSRETLEAVLNALGDNWFYPDGEGEEYNNDPVIEADELLQEELASQEPNAPGEGRGTPRTLDPVVGHSELEGGRE